MAKRIYNQQALFGELYAYLIVVSPPENIRRQLALFKQQMNALADIGERNLYSIGHITLTDKLIDDADFAETIAHFIGRRERFEVRLSGIGILDHGPDKKTLFVNVADHAPIITLMRLVKAKSKFPHLTLAKNISAATLEKLEPFIADFNYEVNWVCEEIVVLKKLMREKQLGFRQRISIPLI